jgi:hypothetical protein
VTEIIRDLLARRPFIPFRVTLAGKVPAYHEVTDPELAELTPSVLRLYRRDPAAPGGKSWTSVLSLLHVATIEITRADTPFVVPAGG